MCVYTPYLTTKLCQVLIIAADETCVLLPPEQQHEVAVIAGTLRDKIIGCLSTRYDVPGPTIRRLLPEKMGWWSKVQILNGGDLIRSASLGGAREDTRNASFVRVRELCFPESH